MTVHIGELHAEVMTAPAPVSAPAAPAPAGTSDQARRAEWIACRVRAEGFDD
jgi:hypothetical protein